MIASLMRDDAGVPNMFKKLKRANKKASPHAPQPIMRIAPRGSSRPSTPRIINPSRGSNSTNRLKFIILASQYVHLVNIDIAAGAEDRDDKCQTDYNFCCSHGQNNKDKHLSIR